MEGEPLAIANQDVCEPHVVESQKVKTGNRELRTENEN